MNGNMSQSGEMPAGRMEEQAAAAAPGGMPGFEMPQGGAFPPGTKVEPELTGPGLVQQMAAGQAAAPTQQGTVEPEMEAYLRSMQAQPSTAVQPMPGAEAGQMPGAGAGQMPGPATGMGSGAGPSQMPTRGMNDPTPATSP